MFANKNVPAYKSLQAACMKGIRGDRLETSTAPTPKIQNRPQYLRFYGPGLKQLRHTHNHKTVGVCAQGAAAGDAGHEDNMVFEGASVIVRWLGSPCPLCDAVASCSAPVPALDMALLCVCVCVCVCVCASWMWAQASTSDAQRKTPGLPSLPAFPSSCLRFLTSWLAHARSNAACPCP